MPVTALRTTLLIAAALPFVYYLLASYSAWRFFRTPHRLVNEFTPSVSILKPVRGLDRNSYDNFATFCRQDYPDYEILFAVADEDDPATDVVRRLIADHPDRSIRLLVGAPHLGPSSKVNKLVRLSREARHDVLVINDSDIRVTPDYLRTVVAPFGDSHVGAVTCLYTGIANEHMASDLESLGIAADFAAGVLTAWQLEGVKFALGATMATRRDRLREIGGFEALASYCAEDFQLGHRIAARGYVVQLSPYVVSSECAARTLGGYLQHQLRWAISTRHSRPLAYGGLLLTQGLPWAVVATLAVPTVAVATGYLGAYFALRMVMALSVATWGLGDVRVVRKWWLLPLRDALAFLVWLAGLFLNRIQWRGSHFVVRDGRLIPIRSRGTRTAAAV